jgi:hypothetical protein
MAANFMAHPEQRHPFEESPIHTEGGTTVLYQGRRITLDETGPGDRLLIRPEDLPGVNGFELKPEGACYEDLCIPVREELFVDADGSRWFDLTAFADLLEQPWVADTESRVWSFGEAPAKRAGLMVDAEAPDLELTDRKGNVVRLADLRGKKTLVVTWSSW